jgi:ElaB/YqjD/DUF883 family membrane-anchored ribosome-binding protein
VRKQLPQVEAISVDSAENNIENAKQKVRNRVEILDGERQANIDHNLSKNLNETKATRQKVFHNGVQLSTLVDNVDSVGQDVNSIDENLKAFRIEGQQVGKDINAIGKQFGEQLNEIKEGVGNTQEAYSQGYRDAMSQLNSAVSPAMAEIMQTAFYKLVIENTYKSESRLILC